MSQLQMTGTHAMTATRLGSAYEWCIQINATAESARLDHTQW